MAVCRRQEQDGADDKEGDDVGVQVNQVARPAGKVQFVQVNQGGNRDGHMDYS